MSEPAPKVLISINSAWNIYHFRGALVKALQRAGYRITSAAPDDAYTERLRALVDRHIPLPMDNSGTSPWRDFLLYLRYIRLLQRERPAALLTYTIKPNIYGGLAARLLGIPTIANVSGLGTAFLRGGWLTKAVQPLYRAAFKNAACVFFQNFEDRDLFLQLKLVAPEKAALLNGSGIDLDYFKPSPVSTHAPGQPLSFILIARLLWDKGIGEYVEAARIVKANYPDTRFCLLGALGAKNRTAIDQAQVEQWVAEGVIDYLGETDDVRSVMAAQDCVVLPSYREGLSRVLLEAAAMGKPLIATDVPGCRQVVDASVNGLLCQPQDAASLAAALLQFIQLPPKTREAMGHASRAKAEREFGEQHIFDAYLAQLKARLP